MSTTATGSCEHTSSCNSRRVALLSLATNAAALSSLLLPSGNALAAAAAAAAGDGLVDLSTLPVDLPRGTTGTCQENQSALEKASAAAGRPPFGPLEWGNKHAIITGANSGIGKAMATDLALLGVSVTLACRDMGKAEVAANEILQACSSAQLNIARLDLGSLHSVRSFAERYTESRQPLHILINNAGVMACPFSLTSDGIEQHFGVNHLGHFLLTNLLLPRMAESARAGGGLSRVVTVTSAAEQLGSANFEDINYSTTGYNRWSAYGRSKLCNCLFSYELARRCASSSFPITSNCFHPGIVDTQLIRYVLPPSLLDSRDKAPQQSAAFARFIGLKSPAEGGSTGVYLALSPQLEGISGRYFEDSHVATSSRLSRDGALAERLWELSADMVSQHLQPANSRQQSALQMAT